MSSSNAVDEIRANRFVPTADYEEMKSNYDYDLDKFLKYSSTRDINPDPVGVESFLTSAYHALEKGLAMEEPRAGSGQRYIPIVLAGIGDLERSGHARFATRCSGMLGGICSLSRLARISPSRSIREAVAYHRSRSERSNAAGWIGHVNSKRNRTGHKL